MTTVLKKANKKGFTLVELVIVIAVLAILAAIAIPTVTNVINTANENVDKANAQTVELAIKSAQAEATAKTWTDAPTNLTVGAALIHEGITALPSAKVDSAVYRAINGKVSLSKDSDNGKIFDASDSVEDVINNTDKGPGNIGD